MDPASSRRSFSSRCCSASPSSATGCATRSIRRTADGRDRSQRRRSRRHLRAAQGRGEGRRRSQLHAAGRARRWPSSASRGSGKSQAFLSIMGLLARNGRTTGRAMLGDVNLLALSPGKLDEYRGRDIAMIFQDPMTSLNPSLRVRTQLAEVLVKHHGIEKDRRPASARSRCSSASACPSRSSAPTPIPHELSGGMRQRVMIAMALLCQPKILIADEPTTALDVTVQAQMLELFKDLTNDFGTALVLITHDLGVVAGLADRMMVMYGGPGGREGHDRRAVLRSAPSLYAGPAPLDAACRSSRRAPRADRGPAAEPRAPAVGLRLPPALRLPLRPLLQRAAAALRDRGRPREGLLLRGPARP